MEGLLSHLNSVWPSIKFTVEVEKEGSLPFLDALLQRKDDGNLDVTVYRKPMHTVLCTQIYGFVCYYLW